MIFLKEKVNRNYVRRISLFVPVLLFMLAACKEKFPAVPSDIIPMTKMENILIDMHIVDAVAETRTMGSGATEMKFTEQYYLQIYKNYGITKEEFLKSYLFYQNNPILLNKLYDDVLSEMSKREAQMNK